VNRDRLKKLVADKRFIPGIYNYCDRWCERCPQTFHCLNFFLSEKEFSNPETHDIRNEAFWRKLSGILGETLELLREAAKKWGIELETLGSMDNIEDMKAKHEATQGLRVRSCNITFQNSTRKQRLSDRIADEVKATLYTSSRWERSRSRKARWSIRSHSSFPDKIFIDGLPIYDLW